MNEQWKELKETITEMRDNDGTGTQQEACKFLANLMDVLEKQMSGSEIPNSSDCISRQVVLDEMYRRKANGDAITAGLIKNLPPVNPQPKTGHWINGDCEGGNCSICGEYYAFYPESGDFNYCPNCGAKMIEPQERENKK